MRLSKGLPHFFSDPPSDTQATLSGLQPYRPGYQAMGIS